jgi:hypothetical protein
VPWVKNQGDAKNVPGRVLGLAPHQGYGSPVRWWEVASVVVERACSGRRLSERVAEARGRMEGGEALVDLKKMARGEGLTMKGGVALAFP